ncbi:MAG: helix-turn-helix transcriptional regulator [Candidatus Ornithospirochaeta sp.]
MKKERNRTRGAIVDLPLHSENYKVNRILGYIRKNWEKVITLDELALYIGSTPQYTSALFSRDMCMTLVDYINSLKINNSVPLLLDTDLPISQISNRCGFQSTSYFIRTFRSITGMTPGEYRKKPTSVYSIDIDSVDESGIGHLSDDFGDRSSTGTDD